MNGVQGRTPSPAGITAPPGDYQSWDDYMHAVERLEQVWEQTGRNRALDYDANHRASLRVSKGMRLAPNAIVFRALLEGQQVPVDALDSSWRRRYRL